MSERMTERVVGILFVVATVGSIVASAVLGSILDGEEYLVGLSSHEVRLIGAALLFVVAATAAVATALLLFPMLRRHAEGPAIGYVGMRIFENVLYVGGVVAMLAMLTVSQSDLIAADAPEVPLVGAALAALQHWSVSIGTLVFFGLGAWVLNRLLYRFRLVPRWLSGWGLAGALLVLAYGLVGVLGGDVGMGSPLTLLAMPIAVQEMVFAGWLMAKGLTDRSAGVEHTEHELVSVS